MKKIMFNLMVIISLVSCTKEELEPKITLNQPYEGGYVVYFHDTTFTVAKIVVGDFNYYEAQLFQQDGWYIPTIDELAHEAKFTGLPEFFSVNGDNDFYWTSTSAAWSAGGVYYDWQMVIYFYNNVYHNAGGDGKENKRHVILFKKFAY